MNWQDRPRTAFETRETVLQAYKDGHTGIAGGKWCTSKADCWKDCAQGKGDCGAMGLWNGTSIAALRAAQTKALALPHTAEALAFDMTDPENGVHPHDSKCELGRRLAKAAIMLDLKDAGAAAIPEAVGDSDTGDPFRGAAAAAATERH